jgi:hypothetical protein
MFRLRFSPLAALAGLVLVFTSCERHHVGELPELQKEHFHPMETVDEPEPGVPKPPPSSPSQHPEKLIQPNEKQRHGQPQVSYFAA